MLSKPETDLIINKIEKCTKLKEAQCIYKLFKKAVHDESDIKLIKSCIDESIFEPRISVDRFYYYLNILSTTENTSDLEDIVEEILSLTKDKAQINTVKRIFAQKGYIVDLTTELTEKIDRCCPHCNNKYTDYEDVTYTICGYSNRGYDWKGCGCDWCFSCGKKLCKRWDNNELYNKLNRFHDRRCCKLHALTTESVYPDDYCQCNSFYVKR